MRKDELRRLDNHWDRRDLFNGHQRRRRLPWSLILIVAVLVAGAFALSRSDLGSLMESLQSLLPGSSDSQTESPQGDPDSLPLLPLPPAPRD